MSFNSLGKSQATFIYKYLGIHFDRHLSFTHHIAKLKDSIRSRTNMLKIITHNRKGLTTAMLLKLYKALIQSVLLYAIPTWLLLPHGQISIIETAQSRTL